MRWFDGILYKRCICSFLDPCRFSCKICGQSKVKVICMWWDLIRWKFTSALLSFLQKICIFELKSLELCPPWVLKIEMANLVFELCSIMFSFIFLIRVYNRVNSRGEETKKTWFLQVNNFCVFWDCSKRADVLWNLLSCWIWQIPRVL